MIVVAGALTGCTTSIIPPADPADPVSVFVLDYGRHSSLVLPETDSHVFVEYAYGDWNWFALDRSRWHDVFPTLFWPTRGALGQRRLPVESDPETILRVVACEDVLEVTVSARQAQALFARLHSQFDKHVETLHYQPLYDLSFVHCETAFHLFHNCNHALAGWLRELDCEVRGPAMTADFIVRVGAETPQARPGEDQEIRPPQAEASCVPSPAP
ncbi:MAG: DUF2459 domain-containing protein [Planctomycetota bacterium]